LEGDGFEVDAEGVEVRAELWEDGADVVPEDNLVGAGGEEGAVEVVWREDVFDYGDEDPEGVFGGWDEEEEVRGDEVHALAVADVWVAAGVGEQDFVEFGYAEAGAEEDVVGEGAGDVHLDLLDDGFVVEGAVHELFVVAGNTHGRGAAALGPNLRTVGDRNASKYKTAELVSFGTTYLAFDA